MQIDLIKLSAPFSKLQAPEIKTIFFFFANPFIKTMAVNAPLQLKIIFK